LANSLLAAWRSYRHRKGPLRELITLAIGLFTGLVILPLAIYGSGRVLLGDYVRGATEPTPAGPLALWTDYLTGLGQGSLAHWLVLLGPYGAYLLWRIARGTRRA
jgi:hypothetical protein